MKVKFLIIGGGVAGLCAAIRLSELGQEPLVIEGGTYPTHKVCGEFLSPECMPILNAWDIHPVSIPKMTVRAHNSSLTFKFPSDAGGLSHMTLDPALAMLATKLGTKIKTNTKVESFNVKTTLQDYHVIQLSSGETVQAEQVIIATGRIPGYSMNPPMLYMGFKAHFKNLDFNDSLQMFSMPGAYLGIAPIENGIYNVACLANLKCVGHYQNPYQYIESAIKSNFPLQNLLAKEKNLFEKWMFAQVPAFGIKQTPNWLHTYFIGDASTSIPPACGNGLSLAILGGRLCAEYAVSKQFLEFKNVWKKRCVSQMFWGKLLHRIMLNPHYSTPLLKFASYFPIVSKQLYFSTRQSLLKND